MSLGCSSLWISFIGKVVFIDISWRLKNEKRDIICFVDSFWVHVYLIEVFCFYVNIYIFTASIMSLWKNFKLFISSGATIHISLVLDYNKLDLNDSLNHKRCLFMWSLVIIVCNQGLNGSMEHDLNVITRVTPVSRVSGWLSSDIVG